MLRKVTAVPATERMWGIPSEVPLDEDDGMPRWRSPWGADGRAGARLAVVSSPV
jgi:hypothetical protein